MANKDSLGVGGQDEESGGLGKEKLRLGRRRKKPAAGKAAKSPWSGSSVPVSTPSEYPGKGSKADVKARLSGVVKRSRQVLVKIPAGGKKTARELRKHFLYLSKQEDEQEPASREQGDASRALPRRPQPLYDETGRRIVGEEAITELAELWKVTGPKMNGASDRPEALHIIFSMPEGTDDRAVFASVRATAQVEFAGHQWVMAQHFDEPQVHCHVSVRIEGADGRRLNPRKVDLARWRERFAHELRERNVEAEATRRRDRLDRDKVKEPWAVAQLRKRGQPTNPAPDRPNPDKARKWNEVEQKVVNAYRDVVTELQASDDRADRALARDLQAFVEKKHSRNQETDRTSPAERSTPEMDIT